MSIIPDPNNVSGLVVKYYGFTIDEVEYPLDQLYKPAPSPNQWQGLGIHTQLDGPPNLTLTGGYEVLLDKVTLNTFSVDPWSRQSCPTTPQEASRLFGGLVTGWQLLPGYSNGWKYNLYSLPETQVPAIRNGRIPANMKADWWDGQTTYSNVSGPNYIPFATVATIWCLP